MSSIRLSGHGADLGIFLPTFKITPDKISRNMDALDLASMPSAAASQARAQVTITRRELRETTINLMAAKGNLQQLRDEEIAQSGADKEEKYARATLWHMKKLAEKLSITGETRDVGTLLKENDRDSAANKLVKKELRETLDALKPSGDKGELSPVSRQMWRQMVMQALLHFPFDTVQAPLIAQAVVKFLDNAPRDEWKNLREALQQEPTEQNARTLANAERIAQIAMDAVDAWQCAVASTPMTIVVEGAGPAGMSAAAQAAKVLSGANAQVIVFEKRAGAPSRANIVALTDGSKSILADIDPRTAALFDFNNPDIGERVGLAPMENMLETVARDHRAFQLYRGFEQVPSATPVEGSHAESVTLSFVHSETGERRNVVADLAIYAVGAGAAKPNGQKAGGRNNPELGQHFSYFDVVGIKDHLGVAVFSLEGKSDSFGVQAEDDNPRNFDVGADKTSHWVNVYTANKKACVLFSARDSKPENKTPQFEAVMRIVATPDSDHPLLGQAERLGMDIVDIELRRANSMVSATEPRIVVGDGAQTPHPYTGSGANAAFSDSVAVRRLTANLLSAKVVSSMASLEYGAMLHDMAFQQFDGEARRIANFCVAKSIIPTVVLGRKDRQQPVFSEV